jgi:hypothetical protein
MFYFIFRIIKKIGKIENFDEPILYLPLVQLHFLCLFVHVLCACMFLSSIFILFVPTSVLDMSFMILFYAVVFAKALFIT